MVWWIAAAQAATGGWEVGAGVEKALRVDGWVEGFRLQGRHRWQTWSLGAAAYGSPWAATPSEFDKIIAQIAAEHTAEAGYQQPFSVDRAGLSAEAVWRPWPLGGDGGGPIALVGVEGRLQEHYAVTYAGSHLTSVRGSGVYVGPVLGAGAELEWGRLVTQLLVADRMLIAPDPSYSDEPQTTRSLQHQPVISLDVLVRLGGAQ